MTFLSGFRLLRPWSFVVTLVPFLVAAAAVPVRTTPERWAVGLLAGLLFHIAVNLLNTWGDDRSGVDAVPGAVITTPQIRDGLVSPRTVLIGGLTAAALGALIGLALAFPAANGFRPDLVLLGIGFVGFLGALNYTTGIKFKYLGLGVPFSALLMGVLEYLAAGRLIQSEGLPPLLPAVPIALLTGAILHGNDMRDLVTDRLAGITTLAQRLGPRGALGFYLICHTAVYILAAVQMQFLPLLALPLSLRTMRRALAAYREDALHPHWFLLERDTGLTLLAYGGLFALQLALIQP